MFSFAKIFAKPEEPKPVPVKQYIPHEQVPIYEQIKRAFELNNSDYLLGKVSEEEYLRINEEINARAEAIAAKRLEKIEKALQSPEAES